MLEELDNYDLLFHNWAHINNALNSNLLSYENHILFKIYSNNQNEQVALTALIDSLFLTLYADLYEASYLISDDRSKALIEKFLEELRFKSDRLSGEAFKRLTYLWSMIPQHIFDVYLRGYIDNQTLTAIETLRNNQNFIDNKLQESNDLKSDIESIKQTLNEQRTEFNFIGLSDGFKSLRQQKQEELDKELTAYRRLMGLIIFIVIAKALGSVIYLLRAEPNLTLLIVSSISVILLLLVLLYFFKISLTNIKSIKSQILQIDLRLTLCQFIHNYNKDSESLRGEGMKDSLDKFEAVIFSPIVAPDDKIPATFEGIDQISGLIGLINKKTP